VCYRFGVIKFGSIKGFNGDDLALGHVHKDFLVIINNVRRASVRERRQCRADRLTLAALVVFRWANYINVIYIMFEVFYTSCE
jgi:hypothetical protein